MTFRAIAIALLGAVFVAAGGYWVDHAAGLNRFVSGQFPIVLYGPMVLILLGGYWLGRPGGVRRFRPAEWAIVAVAMLAASSIPSNGLLRYFTRCGIMPVYANQTNPSWQTWKVLEDLPPILLANDGQYEEDMVAGFLAGTGKPDEPIGIAQVPWGKWQRMLSVWIPLILLMGVASICLAVIVHPQWSRRERLRYPIAEFANTLLEPGTPPAPPIFRRPRFLIAFAALFLLHVINGLARWFPQNALTIPLDFDFSAITQKFSFLHWGWGAWTIGHLMIWPTAVALAFFLAKDVTFSIGISQPLATVLAGILIPLGLMNPEGNFVTGQAFHFQRAGSCLALAAMLLYFGRRYYATLFRAAFSFRRSSQVEPGAVGACRLLLLCVAAFMAILVAVLNLPWFLALAFVLLTLLAYLCVARITAEFGFFYVQIIWYPISVLLGIFGAFALGPSNFITLAVLSTIFVAQPEESVMPFVLQGLMIGSAQGLSTRTTGWAGISGFTLAVLLAVPFALWVDYNYGGTPEGWAAFGQPVMPFDTLLAAKTQLANADRLAASEHLSDLQRLAAASPSRTFLWSAALGFAAVVATYLLRLRLPWWPIHPVLFLIWETYCSAVFFHSFLLAWLIQILISRLGSSTAYRKTKDVMIGVIAGEMAGGLLWILVGGAYYLLTGIHPPNYNVFPF